MKKRLIVGLLTACFLFAGMVGTTHATPVQWTTGSGGNGHWYEIVVTNVSWNTAKSDTEAYTDGALTDWHLATITSQAEQDFIATLLAGYTSPGDGGFQIGGFQPAGSTEPGGGWKWVTGENFSSYNGWGNTPEPNNAGSGEGYLYVDERFGWRWNDYYETNNFYNPTGYIRETAVPEPSTMLLLGSGLLGIVGLNRRRKA